MFKINNENQAIFVNVKCASIPRVLIIILFPPLTFFNIQLTVWDGLSEKLCHFKSQKLFDKNGKKTLIKKCPPFAIP